MIEVIEIFLHHDQRNANHKLPSQQKPRQAPTPKQHTYPNLIEAGSEWCSGTRPRPQSPQVPAIRQPFPPFKLTLAIEVLWEGERQFNSASPLIDVNKPLPCD